MKAVWKLGFPGGISSIEPSCQCRRLMRREFDPWVGRSPGVGNGKTLQYSCLENSIIVHWVAKSRTSLSTHTHTHSLKLCQIMSATWLLKDTNLGKYFLLMMPKKFFLNKFLKSNQFIGSLPLLFLTGSLLRIL